MQLDEVQDQPLIFRSTIDMKSLYKSIRMADPRYADSVVGSPDYMAIETLRGQTYTTSVDYWSLGCILFEWVLDVLQSPLDALPSLIRRELTIGRTTCQTGS